MTKAHMKKSVHREGSKNHSAPKQKAAGDII
jgi:hypothetical protein